MYYIFLKYDPFTKQVRTLTDEGLQPFSPRMLAWQLFLGASLSCTISVKFVGLFIVLFVGLRTVADLWNILGDLKKPVVSSWSKPFVHKQVS